MPKPKITQRTITESEWEARKEFAQAYRSKVITRETFCKLWKSSQFIEENYIKLMGEK